MLKNYAGVALVAAVTSLPAGATAQEKEIAALATTLSSRITASGKKTIAVMDIGSPQACVTQLGRYISEELAVGLLESGPGYVLVNRAQLQKLLAELKLGQSGLADPATAKQLGKLAGADALVVGTMTFFGDTGRVTVQVLDTEPAATVAASAVSLSRTAAIDKLNQCADIPAPARVDVTAAAGRVDVPAPVNAAFENKLVRIMVTSLTASTDTISVSLSVQNVTSAPLRLSSVACARWAVVDDNGTQWPLSKTLGMSHQLCGPGNYSFDSSGRPRVQYEDSRFGDFEPGVPVSLVFQFQSFQGRPNRTFTLTGEFLRSVRSAYETFAVVLPGLTRK